MKIVGIGTINFGGYFGTDSVVYEYPPIRRMILCEDDYCPIPFPWIYFIVAYRKSGEYYETVGLYPAFRPSKITSRDDALYYFLTMNTLNGGQICLGDDFENNFYCHKSLEKLCENAIGYYFNSSFSTYFPDNLSIPTMDGKIDLFDDWAEFKNHEEININWEKCPKIFNYNHIHPRGSAEFVWQLEDELHTSAYEWGT